MSQSPHCQLVAKDFSVLEGMLDRLEAKAREDAAVVRLLRRKIASAQICFRDALDPRVTTINSRVQFRADDGSVQTRVLTLDDQPELPHADAALSISSLQGLALLGRMEGETVLLELPDGTTQRLHILSVVQDGDAARPRPVRAGLKVIAGSQKTNVRPLRQVEVDPDGPDDDDPGPRAA